MGYSHGSVWTPERVAQLKEMRLAGKDAGEIAAAVGCTRSQTEKALARYAPFRLLLGTPAARAAQPAPFTPPAALDSPEPAVIGLDQIEAALDTPGAILREIAHLPDGKVVDEAELARRVCGTDRARFNRVRDNRAEAFRNLRIKIRLNREATEARWYWGKAPDIEKIRTWRDL